MARNIPWTRDELIIALDFYLKNRKAAIGMKHKPEMETLSAELNELAILHQLPKGENFRSPNAVYLKLMNFHNIDPEHKETTGLSHGSQKDAEVWVDFIKQPEVLTATAKTIRQHIKSFEEKDNLLFLKDDPEQVLFEPTIEGRILSSNHIRRERNPRLAEKLKDEYYDKHKYIDCCVCKFDYEKRYGKHGHKFMEAHHIRPLSELPPEGTKTKPEDLALVCASCHRMIHRKSPWLTMDELRGILKT